MNPVTEAYPIGDILSHVNWIIPGKIEYIVAPSITTETQYKGIILSSKEITKTVIEIRMTMYSNMMIGL